MSGGSKTSSPVDVPTTLVLDNGASSIKAGFVTAETDTSLEKPRVIPNCIVRDRHKKVYVGSEFEKCKDFGEISYRRPVEKGYIVNWEAQKEIWDREFFNDKAPLRCDPSETRLVLTEQPNALPALQNHCDQMVFEEFGFSSYYRGVGPAFNAYHDVQAIFQSPRAPGTRVNFPAEILLLIDSGFSHTTVTPILAGRPLQSAIRRLDVGGKLLTNHLTRLISLRHFDMRNEPYVVNEMKEKACYVALDFKSDLEKTWKGTQGEKRPEYVSGAGIAKDYILPDSHTRFHGILQDYEPGVVAKAKKGGFSNEDILTLRNERFAVPELLFNPSDIKLRQPGIPDMVMQSLSVLPEGLWPGLLANIVVVGGNTLFEGFAKRLEDELRTRVPDVCRVRVARPTDPITKTWEGAANFAKHENANKLAVTKAEYDEFGGAWVARKFATGLGVPDNGTGKAVEGASGNGS
ncbi:Actin family [Naviculisporaceae sp. PSN 640]